MNLLHKFSPLFFHPCHLSYISFAYDFSPPLFFLSPLYLDFGTLSRLGFLAPAALWLMLSSP